MIIPKRFIRVWLGNKRIPARYQQWWQEFQDMHPSWEFAEITDADVATYLPASLRGIYFWGADSEAMRSDVLRLGVLHDLGGVYVDADTMPVRPYDPLMSDPRPFTVYQTRAKKTLQNCVMASPPQHPAVRALIDELPEYYKAHQGEVDSPVHLTGPKYLTHVWGQRDDVRLFDYECFNPLGRIAMAEFTLRAPLNPKTYSAHYVTGSWWKDKGRRAKGGDGK